MGLSWDAESFFWSAAHFAGSVRYVPLGGILPSATLKELQHLHCNGSESFIIITTTSNDPLALASSTRYRLASLLASSSDTP